MSDQRPVAQRRFGGGARREASERVTIRREAGTIEGWTLNVSRGGLRVVVEDPLDPGELVEILVGDVGTPRPAKIIWTKTATDGQIAGIQLLDVPGAAAPPEDAPGDEPS